MTVLQELSTDEILGEIDAGCLLAWELPAGSQRIDAERIDLERCFDDVIRLLHLVCLRIHNVPHGGRALEKVLRMVEQARLVLARGSSRDVGRARYNLRRTLLFCQKVINFSRIN